MFAMWLPVMPIPALATPHEDKFSIESKPSQQLKPEIHELKQGVLIFNSRIQVIFDIDYKINQGSTLTLIQRTNSDHIKYDFASSSYYWILPKYPYCDCLETLAKDGKYWISPGTEIYPGTGQEEIVMQDTPGGGYDWADEGSPLQQIESHESYTFYLVSITDSTGRMKLLKRVDWSCGFTCQVDTSKPIGHRVTLLKWDHVKLKRKDPEPGELAELIREGVIGGKQCANRDRQLWRIAKADGRKKLILTGTGHPPAGSIY